MANFGPLSSAVSFDDLLKANKQQFDQHFLGADQGIGPARLKSSAADVGGFGLGQPLFGSGRASFDLYAMLNERFGSRWSSEVVEHKTERGSVTVLCKLTVDGSSKMQFGSARANGDEGAALSRATEAALRGCAEMFGDATVIGGARRAAGGNAPRRRARPTARRAASRRRRRGKAAGSTRSRSI